MSRLPTHFTTDESLTSVHYLRYQLAEAVAAWLTRSPSAETRSGYTHDLTRFLRHVGIPDGAWDELPRIRLVVGA